MMAERRKSRGCRACSASQAMPSDAGVSATLQHIPAPMKESLILTFGRQLKTSLQHVHQKGYGHNDVKAANIFISAAGERQPITLLYACMLSLLYLTGTHQSVCMQVNAYLGTLGLL